MNAIRVLMVEDDDVDRETIRRVLGKLNRPIEVVEAASCHEAKSNMATTMFDCVLLDYHLGDALGIELLPTIRKHRPEVCPVIMITTRSEESLVVQAMREGVYDYISKSHLDPTSIHRALEGSLHWAEVEQELIQANDRLHHLSLYDTLTGLPNRVLFFDRLEQQVLASERSAEPFSLLMMDLNLFKEVNDSLGHDAGDTVLAQVAQRLQSVVRKSDTVARLGGDEFACLLPAAQTQEDAERVAEKIVDAMREPILIDQHAVSVGISVGIARYPIHATDAKLLLKRADQAMYRAKRGTGGVEIFSDDCVSQECHSVLITNRLVHAIRTGELVVHFQPKIDLHSLQVVGKEALVRWRHPERGLVLPDGFVPAAEKSSAIAALTTVVLEMALDQERIWREAGFCVPLSVNFSGRVLDDRTLASQITKMLRDRDLSPDCLIAELTETALIANPIRARETLLNLCAAGIRISIDDFGAGYTSFRQLRELEISEIKIDGLYVKELVANGRDASIVRSIAELGRGFDIDVVAEGVEDELSWCILESLGCRYAQGFSIAMAMPAPQFDGWIRDWPSRVPVTALQPRIH
jgi:diguanylate cyclase (GGDEF)-like protein